MSDTELENEDIGKQPNKAPLFSFKRCYTPIFEYEVDPDEEECYDFLMNGEEEEEEIK